MTTKHKVRLIGGPFDGEWREVSEYARWFTEPVSYQRADDGTFVHCRTPTRLGDAAARDFDLPELQLLIEGD